MIITAAIVLTVILIIVIAVPSANHANVKAVNYMSTNVIIIIYYNYIQHVTLLLHLAHETEMVIQFAALTQSRLVEADQKYATVVLHSTPEKNALVI